jgi:hypothetical protein
MDYWNGAPSVRIWRIGTHRILGVSEGRFALAGFCNLPRWLRDTLDARKAIIADFQVCPFTRSEAGVMQLVCVDTAYNVRTRPSQF